MSETTDKSGTNERVQVGASDVMAQGTIAPATKLFTKAKAKTPPPERGGRHTMQYVRAGKPPPPWTPRPVTPATPRTDDAATPAEPTNAAESQPVASLGILSDEEQLAQRAANAFGGQR